MTQRDVPVNVTPEIRERLKFLKGADSYKQFLDKILKEKEVCQIT